MDHFSQQFFYAAHLYQSKEDRKSELLYTDCAPGKNTFVKPLTLSLYSN